MGLYIAERLNERNLGYLHLNEPDCAEGPVLDDDFRIRIREAFSGVIIAADGYDAAEADRVLQNGWADAIAFGKSFIANPDLSAHLAIGADLNPLRPELFYGGGSTGSGQSDWVRRRQVVISMGSTYRNPHAFSATRGGAVERDLWPSWTTTRTVSSVASTSLLPSTRSVPGPRLMVQPSC